MRVMEVEQSMVEQVIRQYLTDAFAASPTAIFEAGDSARLSGHDRSPEDADYLCDVPVFMEEPPARSRRCTRRLSRSITLSGCGRSGAAWPRALRGRCSL